MIMIIAYQYDKEYTYNKQDSSDNEYFPYILYDYTCLAGILINNIMICYI